MRPATDRHFGVVIASNDPSGPNSDFTPAGGIPGGTILAAGDYYVVGDPAVPNVDLIAAATLENDNESIELYDAAGSLLDAVIYEANKGTGFASAPVLAQANVGYWGNVTTIESTFQSTSRWRDGRDTNTNGRDFGLIPWTPGASNNLPVNPAYQIPDVDPDAVGSDVTGLTGSFVNPTVIDPTVADGNNPNAIPASPQGGNAIVAWDPSGGGDTAASNELADQFLISAYLDTRPLGAGGAEQSTFGLGTTDTFHNFADINDDLFPGPGVTANGNIGVGWFFEKEDSASITRLSLIDFGKGGNSEPGTDWTVITTIDLFGEASGWHTLAIDYDAATGDVVAEVRRPDVHVHHRGGPVHDLLHGLSGEPRGRYPGQRSSGDVRSGTRTVGDWQALGHAWGAAAVRLDSAADSLVGGDVLPAAVA